MRTDDDQADIEQRSAARISAAATIMLDLSHDELLEALAKVREKRCLACGHDAPCYCDCDPDYSD